MKKNVLVLGATGMLGNTVFNFLSKETELNVYGTQRKKKIINNLFFLDAHSLKRDLENVIKKIGKVDYVINCIGALQNRNKEELTLLNTNFPLELSKFANKYGYKIIHVSSDAVFDDNAGEVSEIDKPNPSSEYGKSKLKGEPKSVNSISLRTSIIGADPLEHKGLLEWVLKTKSPLQGYVNQNWTGCTSLQFATLCKKIILNNSFEQMRKKSGVFHFSPLRNLTKFDLVKAIVKSFKLKKVVLRSADKPITRELVSRFDNYTWTNEFEEDINLAIRKLIRI